MFRLSITALLLGVAWGAMADVKPVSPDELKKWQRQVLPLPHQMAIAEKAQLPAAQVGIKLAENAGDIEMNAVRELKEAIKGATGAEPAGSAFQILCGVLDKDGKVCGLAPAKADELRKCPNNGQAYLIEPVGKDKLLVAALSPVGLYYGVNTLTQLVAKEAGPQSLAIPLATIVDYPDILERGTWNANGRTFLSDYYTFKLNFDTINCFPAYRDAAYRKGGPLPMDAQNTAEQRTEAMLHGVKLVPKIVHINYHPEFGLFETYPDLAGKGERSFQKRFPSKFHQCPCASNPLLVKVMVENMEALAAQGYRDVSAWASEWDSTCECANCLRDGQFPLEARAFAKAWSQVRQKYPDFKMRFFLSYDTTPEVWKKVIAELPADAMIERCCDGGQTPYKDRFYTSDKYGFDDLARAGRWVASYRLGPPAAFEMFPTYKDEAYGLKARKWQGGYAISGFSVGGKIGKYFCPLALPAIGEWLWNVDGRSYREFGEAWAVKNKYANPEAVGEWTELMSPIFYDFDTCLGEPTAPFQRGFNYAIQGTSLQDNILYYFKGPNAFTSRLAVARKARDIAASFDEKTLLLETEKAIIKIRLLELASGFSSLDWKKKPLADADKAKAEKLFAEVKPLFDEMQAVNQKRYDLLPDDVKPFFVASCWQQNPDKYKVELSKRYADMESQLKPYLGK